MWGPRGLGDLGRMAIYIREQGSTCNYFQGFGEQAHSLGNLGSLAKKVLKNLTLKENPSFRLLFFKKKIFGFWGNPLYPPPPPALENINVFICHRANMLI